MLTSLVVTVLEIAQAWAPVRHPRFSDALVGLAVGVVGAWLGHLTADHFTRIRNTCDPSRRRHFGVGCLIGWELALTGGIALCHGGVHLSDWSDRYPLILANENTADRPWRGQLRGVAIYGRALDPVELARASALPMTSANVRTREQWGAACLYVFDDQADQRAAQRIESKPQMDLVLPPPGPVTWVRASRGIQVTGPMAIRSETNVAGLSQLLQRADALTIEAELVIPQGAQYGPARFVSISASPTDRNLTLAQVGYDLDFRVRTPRTGANGAWAMCRTRNGRLDSGAHHVAATFHDGVMRLYIDGVEARPPLYLYRISTLLFRGDFRFASIVAALLLVGPAGWLAAVAVRGSRRTRDGLFLGCLAAVPPIAASFGMSALANREQDTLFLVFGVLAGALGAVVAALGMRRTPSGADPNLGKQDS
ncbi:MAG: hypothetical protein IID42_09725 [Planctomycetes bacterium]|nr:hypothetical protein [Planctomycetota bacterium]